MKYKDKISIIIPCYNVEKYIEKCIFSVMQQTYSNIEIIVIDDGSKDRTLEMLYNFAKIDKRIIVISKTNSGVSDTRNIGIEKSTGNYIMFVDADDFLEKNAVELLYSTIVKINAKIVRGKYRRIQKDKVYNEEEITKYNYMSKQEILKNILSGNIRCYIWLLLIDIRVLNDYNIMFNEKIKVMEDTLFYVQLLEKEQIYFFDEIIYNYIENVDSATGNIKNTKKIYKEELKAEECIVSELKKNGEWNEELKEILIKDIIIDEICNNTWNLYRKGEIEVLKDFLKYIANSKKINKAFSIESLKHVRLDKRIIINLIMKRKYRTLKLIYSIKKKIYEILKGGKNKI